LTYEKLGDDEGKEGKKSHYKSLTNCWFLDYRLKAKHIGILYTIFMQKDTFHMNKTWILDNIGVTPDRNFKAFDDLIEFGYIEVLGTGNNRKYIFNEFPYNDPAEYKKIVEQHDKKMGKYTWRKTQESKQSDNTTDSVVKNERVPTVEEGEIPPPIEVTVPSQKGGLHNIKNTEYYKHNNPPLGSNDPNPPKDESEFIEPDEEDLWAQEPIGR